MRATAKQRAFVGYLTREASAAGARYGLTPFGDRATARAASARIDFLLNMKREGWPTARPADVCTGCGAFNDRRAESTCYTICRACVDGR